MLSRITSPLLLILLACFALKAQASHPNQQDIDKILTRHQLPKQALSLVSLPLSDNPKLQTMMYNEHASVNPASVIKLVTTYAALDILGPTFTWKTELLTDGEVKGDRLIGNLYFRSGGDPKLTIERLWLLLRELQMHGISHIEGDLILDASYYQIKELAAFKGEKRDLYRPFMVDANALLVNFNTQRFIVRGAEEGAQVISDPFVSGIKLENNVRVLPDNNCRNTNIFYHPRETADGFSMQVSGTIAKGCQTQKHFSLVKHEKYTEGVIRGIWAEMGGTFSGTTKYANTPDDARQLAMLPSLSVTETIKDINKFSNNTMAKQLFLTIGANQRQADDEDDMAAAQRAITQWWQTKGITKPNLVIENGSGLSRDERLTAFELALMLKDAARNPYAPEFMSSLPLVAIDGTMKNRLKRSTIAGHARIKTGTLRDVRAIAGYSMDKDGNQWIIVAILNSPRNINNGILDSLLNALYTQTAIR